ERLLVHPSGQLVLKRSRGQVGAEAEVVSCKDFNPATLITKMKSGKYDLAEEYAVQHPSLMALSPAGLNTVRIFTQLHNDNVDFLGARLRISVNSVVDNMAAGNLAAPVDMETGVVTGPGVYSDITKQDQAIHPVTKQSIIGFQLPYWPETLEMIRSAALLCPDNKSVGWDIAITSEGPELIEGNHNWCKLLWQLPVKQGLKHLLKEY
ncbi:MAG TPA: sugar-transfer associated ATP-grasp domain-containing protein, partial [Bacteroidales bacterium]|nr:sugar-transfer associated ATP-grasp domain-containing protein [Bacteroidales bacterium]